MLGKGVDNTVHGWPSWGVHLKKGRHACCLIIAFRFHSAKTNTLEAMVTKSSMLALAMTVTVLGCGRNGRGDSADTTGIALVPPDTTQIVSRQELPPAPPAVQPTAPPARTERPRTQPAPPPAAAPAPAPAPAPEAVVVRAGTEIVASTTSEVSTRRNKAGETFTANVTEAVESGGRTVIPAGATVTFKIIESKEAENRDKPGSLVILPVSITTGGKTYDINAEVTDLQYELKGRGVTAGDAGKVAAGAAVGAIVGQILTKKTGGTVVGGAIGAAAGTAIAIRSADKDIVVPSGGRVVIKLKDPLTRSGD